MKKILTTIVLVALSISVLAQQHITKFLGIPIDGYKIDMIHKLAAKGFVYDSNNDCLTGEFNGSDVFVFVGTNNNKVYRIMLVDQKWSNETDIKIRFNKLCSQFEKNGKYVNGLFVDDYKLSDEDDISYQMNVEKKRIEAVYYQAGSKEELEKEVEEFESEVPNQATDTVGLISNGIRLFYVERLMKRPVWFMIDEDYGKYRILMYYDNEFNHSDGEDL